MKTSVICWVTILAAWSCLGGSGGVFGQDVPPIEAYSTIRVDVNTVRVRVAVTDALNRLVTGLTPDHFAVYEDKVKQEIVNFTHEAAPVTLGLVFDISDSMRPKIGRARQSAIELLEGGDAQDEFFLVLFNQRARLAQPLTRDIRLIQNAIGESEPRGQTALLDAIYMGLEQSRRGNHRKRALIVVTDGEDNNSRYTINEVREFALEIDCQVYIIGEHGLKGYGGGVMRQLARMTGGRVFFPNSLNELTYFVSMIHAELRHQYVLGYQSTNTARDGSWRRVVVRLQAPPGMPRLFVNHREGYHAPRH